MEAFVEALLHGSESMEVLAQLPPASLWTLDGIRRVHDALRKFKNHQVAETIRSMVPAPAAPAASKQSVETTTEDDNSGEDTDVPTPEGPTTSGCLEADASRAREAALASIRARALRIHITNEGARYFRKTERADTEEDEPCAVWSVCARVGSTLGLASARALACNGTHYKPTVQQLEDLGRFVENNWEWMRSLEISPSDVPLAVASDGPMQLDEFRVALRETRMAIIGFITRADEVLSTIKDIFKRISESDGDTIIREIKAMDTRRRGTKYRMKMGYKHLRSEDREFADRLLPTDGFSSPDADESRKVLASLHNLRCCAWDYCCDLFPGETENSAVVLNFRRGVKDVRRAKRRSEATRLVAEIEAQISNATRSPWYRAPMGARNLEMESFRTELAHSDHAFRTALPNLFLPMEPPSLELPPAHEEVPDHIPGKTVHTHNREPCPAVLGRPIVFETSTGGAGKLSMARRGVCADDSGPAHWRLLPFEIKIKNPAALVSMLCEPTRKTGKRYLPSRNLAMEIADSVDGLDRIQPADYSTMVPPSQRIPGTPFGRLPRDANWAQHGRELWESCNPDPEILVSSVLVHHTNGGRQRDVSDEVGEVPGDMLSPLTPCRGHDVPFNPLQGTCCPL